jgi:mono/diheme cytochrome c family protein
MDPAGYARLRSPSRQESTSMLKLAKKLVVGLVAVLVVLVVGVYGLSGMKLSKDYTDVAGHPLILPAEADEVAEGRRLLEIYHCTGCHGEDLGGTEFIDNPIMGRIHTPNLTTGRGGVAVRYGPSDWERAIRHGVRPDGSGLVIMPSEDYGELSNQDLGRMVAWLEQSPPVDREPPSRRIGPMPRALLSTGVFALAPEFEHHAEAVVEAIAREATAEFGRYIGRTCSGCHGVTFAGGVEIEPGTPPSANLTPHPTDGIGSWSLEDFERAMRTGVRPDGRELDAMMPWRAFAQFDAVEIEALWTYLQSLDPVADAPDD